jgi:hypothetical protein
VRSIRARPRSPRDFCARPFCDRHSEEVQVTEACVMLFWRLIAHCRLWVLYTYCTLGQLTLMTFRSVPTTQLATMQRSARPRFCPLKTKISRALPSRATHSPRRPAAARPRARARARDGPRSHRARGRARRGDGGETAGGKKRERREAHCRRNKGTPRRKREGRRPRASSCRRRTSTCP